MTFSIAGRCSRTGLLGAAIATSSIAVTNRCVWVAPNVGAVLSQSVTDPRLGQLGLSLMREGFGASAVLEQLRTARPHTEWRQLAILDAEGGKAWFDGERVLGRHTGAVGADCVAIGNILASQAVPRVMVEAFLAAAEADLTTRLLRALEAGLGEGGEDGEEHSAGVLVCGRESWPLVNLRVDWDDEPIQKLHHLWDLYKPQMDDYVARAKDPARAPAF